MAKRKHNFYAVKIGRNPGIYSSWDECNAQVNGFSGALYKGFKTKQEAEVYLSEKSYVDTHAENNEKECETDVVIYVDGSFDAEFGVYGYGFVVILKDGTVREFYGAGNDRETARLRNVAGEIIAAMNAVKYAIANKFNSVTICYDYNGIEFWATGEWKTNNDLTARYAANMRKLGREIDIRFQKVIAHTGVEYNEVADRLAKQAIISFVSPITISRI